MEYDRGQFLRLVQAVEDQGGRQLDKRHSAQTYDLTGDKRKVKEVTLESCGKRATFEVPYETEDGSTLSVEMCAYCDNMGLMTRFFDQVQGD